VNLLLRLYEPTSGEVRISLFIWFISVTQKKVSSEEDNHLMCLSFIVDTHRRFLSQKIRRSMVQRKDWICGPGNDSFSLAIRDRLFLDPPIICVLDV
jgi:hypothetical protein